MKKNCIMNTTTIPTSEFKERIRKFQANIKKEGLDACLGHGIRQVFE